MSQSVLGKYLWLNNNLLEDTLRRQQGDESIFVKTFEIKKAVTNRKQSYWCDVVRLGINFTNSANVSKTSDFTLKIARYNPYMEESLEKYDPFKRELFFHQEVLPKIEELLLSVPDNTELTDKAVLIVNERPQPKYLLIEQHDEGFSKVDRRSGLDVEHLKVALKSLAKLHATSAMLPEDALNNHQQPNISEYFKVFHTLFVNCIRALVDEISSENDEEAKALVRKLNAFERNMIEKCSDAFMLGRDEFGVLCHGDLWMDNLLFKYDDASHPTDVRMVNFGLSYFGSPGIDLAYLLFTSSSDEVKDYEIDVSLQYYHSCLHQNLIALDFRRQIPTLIQIHNSFMKSGVIGVVYSCLLLPMRFADRSLTDLSCLVQQTDEDLSIRRELFNNADLKRRFQFLLNFFDRKGFLE